MGRIILLADVGHAMVIIYFREGTMKSNVTTLADILWSPPNSFDRLLSKKFANIYTALAQWGLQR